MGALSSFNPLDAYTALGNSIGIGTGTSNTVTATGTSTFTTNGTAGVLSWINNQQGVVLNPGIVQQWQAVEREGTKYVKDVDVDPWEAAINKASEMMKAS